MSKYAILSHTWEDEEVTHQDIKNLAKAKQMKGFQKINYLCEQARKDDLPYAWIDTCCIDKSSSAELSEAINSMYRWYRQAKVCYVYLADVRLPISCQKWGFLTRDSQCECLSTSRWFTRGWTLQEMIAPMSLDLYDANWQLIGSREVLGTILERITNVPYLEVGVHMRSSKGPEGQCAAMKLSWAAHRNTARPEDRVYSMLGLLDVNMPLLYGEGEKKAFRRLQREIFENSGDLSMLLHNGDWSIDVLAPSLNSFRHCGNIVFAKVLRPQASASFNILSVPSTFTRSSVALQVNVPTLENDGKLYAILDFRKKHGSEGLIAIELYTRSTENDKAASQHRVWHKSSNSEDFLSIAPLRLQHAQTSQLLLCPNHVAAHDLAHSNWHHQLNLALDDWAKENLIPSFDDTTGSWRVRSDNRIYEYKCNGTSFTGPRLAVLYGGSRAIIVFKLLSTSTIRPTLLCALIPWPLGTDEPVVEEHKWNWIYDKVNDDLLIGTVALHGRIIELWTTKFHLKEISLKLPCREKPRIESIEEDSRPPP